MLLPPELPLQPSAERQNLILSVGIRVHVEEPAVVLGKEQQPKRLAPQSVPD